MEPLDTTYIQERVDRLRAGDRDAYDELLRMAGDRLGRLARKLLDEFPAVARWQGYEDVLQQCQGRLRRALEVVRPESTRHFFNLASKHIRWELLKLLKQHQRDVVMANHESHGQRPDNAAGHDPRLDRPEDADRVSVRTRVLDAIEELDATQREVVDLIYFQRFTTTEVGELLNVSGRTVSRIREKALKALEADLGHEFNIPVGT